MKTLNNKSKWGSIVTSLLMLVVFLMPMSQPAQALNGKAPAIILITPKEPTAGYGQLITIFGFNLYNPQNPSFTKVTFTQGTLSVDGSVLLSSTANELFVRVPYGLAPGDATVVTVHTLDDNLVSNGVIIVVKETPATPIIRRLAAYTPFGLPIITSAAPNQQIAISAYAIDTNALAIYVGFSQGLGKIQVQGSSTTNPRGEVLVVVNVPSGMTPGHAFVQVRVTVAGELSNWSVPLGLTIN